MQEAIQSTAPPSHSSSAMRAAILEGLATKLEFAEAIGKCARIVNIYISAGMPVVRIGRTPYIPIAEARQWLLRPRAENSPPRRVGRPRKTASK